MFIYNLSVHLNIIVQQNEGGNIDLTFQLTLSLASYNSFLDLLVKMIFLSTCLAWQDIREKQINFDQLDVLRDLTICVYCHLSMWVTSV